MQEAVFCFNPKLLDKFFCEKTACSLCSPYAMSHIAPFQGILEELRMWQQDSEGINSVTSCYISVGYQVNAETARDRVSLVSGCNAYPLPSLPLPRNEGIKIKPVYERSHNLPTIRRIGISIFISRVIYHYLLSQGKCWNLLSKLGIWSFLCRESRRNQQTFIHICTHTPPPIYTHTHTVSCQCNALYKNNTNIFTEIYEHKSFKLFSFVYQRYTLSSRLLL